jgi:hypothetical protein
VNPRSGQDRLPALEWAAEEYVAGEEGKGKLLVPIFPAVNSSVERKKGFESLTGQNAGYIFFVLVTRMHRIPG